MASLDDAPLARRLVQHITEQHGYLTAEETKAISDPELRLKIELALLRKDQLIGPSVLALAKNLHTSKARFVLDMLRNADDKSYQNARSAGQAPYISFAVYPDRIVVECNDDGFTEANLSAICAVSQSSETAAQGYVDEKGIGFKSVFIVAWKVHIQSHAFSFSFTHRQGDSGMGMVSPVWEDATTHPARGVTRITLHLHEEATSGNLRQSVKDQFDNLQETLLLFMKNLRKVTVAFHGESGQAPYKSTDYSVSKPERDRVVVKTVSTNDKRIKQECSTYHVTTRMATGLPRNENCADSGTELANQAYSAAEIILAFPLTTNSEPIIRPQSVFVFLPVRSVGLNFIVQADFVTDAGRQDIVSDSPRNKILINEVAKTFILAVTQFCHHPTLLYQWLKYLPPRNDPHRGALWAQLVDQIAAELSFTPAFVGRGGSRLLNMSNLARPPKDILDREGNLLFRQGGVEDEVISSAYSKTDLDAIGEYGLRRANWIDILRWVQHDLASGSSSLIRSNMRTKDWYTRFAKLMQRPFQKNWKKRSTELRSSRLVPLADGTWVSTETLSVYSRCVNGLDIPSDLDLCILSPDVTHPELLELYRLLGVQAAPVNLVRDEILKRYSHRSDLTLEQSRAHLTFLYQSFHELDTDSFPYTSLSVFVSGSQLKEPTRHSVYIQNDNPYGAWELFRKTDPGKGHGADAPGYENALFLDQRYFQGVPVSPNNLPWKKWLTKVLGVKDQIHFDRFEKDGELRYLQIHRPEKFLGAIREYHAASPLSPDLTRKLRQEKVLCKNGVLCDLKSSYFPTIELEQRVKQYVGSAPSFPWLLIHDAPSDEAHRIIPEAWRSLLDALEVGVPADDVQFALEMLLHVCLQISADPSLDTVKKLFALYGHMATRLSEAEDRDRTEELIRSVFETEKYFYIPCETGPCLASLEACVWTAPAAMKSKMVLSLLWKDFLKNDTDAKLLLSFFKNVVRVPDCSSKSFVEEVKFLKNSNSDDIDIMKIWYKAIDKARKRRSADLDELRKPFLDEALIYLPLDNGQSSWHDISDCAWSGAATLRNKASLNEEYNDLEDFFVDFLGVRRINVEMAIDELKDAGQRLSLTDVKSSILTVNSLLEIDKPGAYSLDSGDPVFPVREADGTLGCVSSSVEFFVIDLSYEAGVPKGRVRFLDFSLEEVIKLQPFLRWANLEDRLLSNNTKKFPSRGDSPAELVSDREQQISNRARALLRLATHAEIPRSLNRQNQEVLYQLLRTAQVYGTDHVASCVLVSQSVQSYEADGKPVVIHLEKSNMGLENYLPRNRRGKKHGINNILTKKVMEWIMTGPKTLISTNTTAGNLTAKKDVLTTDRSMLDASLEENGLATINIDNQDDNEHSDTALIASPERLDGRTALNLGSGDGAAPHVYPFDVSTATEDDVFTEYTPSRSSVHTETFSTVLSRSSHSSYSSPRQQPFDQESISSKLPFRPPSFPVTPPRLPSDDTQYNELLRIVTDAARRGTVPHAFDQVRSTALADSRQSFRFRFRGSSQIERDRKIGAAGELYVFELLSRLRHEGESLPNFTRDNWQSNIRTYGAAHPEYSDLAPWTGLETSDIVYPDSSGTLTAWMVAAGYLDDQIWSAPSRKMKYSIDVKATTSSCETPFCMSKAQYARMERNVLSPEHSDMIYVIFRVYNLGSESMGLKIYMDPGTLRREGSLLFTAEHWSVKPAPVT